MQNNLVVFSRITQQIEEEKVYGGFFLRCLYSNNFLSRLVSKIFCPLICHNAFFSHLYGKMQSMRYSRSKITPFVEKYHIDTSEFVKSLDEFTSFNDFFIRELKKEARPVEQDPSLLVLPADGRYLAVQDAYANSDVWVKGKHLAFGELLGRDRQLIKQYDGGAMLIGRLAPVDYHRFHFPCDCIPGETRLINGSLYSVNPIALKKNINYLTENKRAITLLQTEHFGTIVYIEIGATHVGSIHQTFVPRKTAKRGEEKGYFSFGGSCLILLFEPNRIIFENDLLEYSAKGIETRALMGQIMALKADIKV